MVSLSFFFFFHEFPSNLCPSFPARFVEEVEEEEGTETMVLGVSRWLGEQASRTGETGVMSLDVFQEVYHEITQICKMVFFSPSAHTLLCEN